MIFRYLETPMQKLLIAVRGTCCCTLALFLGANSFGSALCNEEKLTEQNFRRIIIGMSKVDVFDLIGQPADYRKGPTEFPAVRFFPGILAASIWENDQVRIMIIF